VTALSMGLAACGGGDGGGAQASVPGGPEVPGLKPVAGTLYPNLSGKEVTFVANGGEAQKNQVAALITPFAERSGLKVLEDSPVDFAKLMAQVDSGNVTWDIVNAQSSFTVANCGKYLQPITDIDRSLLLPEAIVDDCAVPIGVGSVQLLYNADLFKDNPPTSFADFFDLAKYPGPRGFWTDMNTYPYEVALLADGVAPEQMYPLDYDRALRKWDTIRDDIVFFKALGDGQEQLTAKRVAMSVITSTRFILTKVQGSPYEPVWNQNLATFANYAIPKNAPNLDAAKAALQYMATPEAQMAHERLLYTGPALKDYKLPPDADEILKKYSPALPEIVAQRVYPDQLWYKDHFAEATEKWNNWLVGG
jgi:putative spermidine/putrescine transport system substrate-binding protein